MNALEPTQALMHAKQALREAVESNNPLAIQRAAERVAHAAHKLALEDPDTRAQLTAESKRRSLRREVLAADIERVKQLRADLIAARAPYKACIRAYKAARNALRAALDDDNAHPVAHGSLNDEAAAAA